MQKESVDVSQNKWLWVPALRSVSLGDHFTILQSKALRPVGVDGKNWQVFTASSVSNNMVKLSIGLVGGNICPYILVFNS